MTSEFYQKNASSYIEETITSDLSHEYDLVLPYLIKGAEILDVGFGSSRDMLFFQRQGYRVEGFDLSTEFVLHAKELGLPVWKEDVRTFSSSKRYDLIWCCCSLLHLTRDELGKVIPNLLSHLKKEGILFLSMKVSEREDGEDLKGRYITYLHKEDLEKIKEKALFFEIKKAKSSVGEEAFVDLLFRA